MFRSSHAVKLLHDFLDPRITAGQQAKTQLRIFIEIDEKDPRTSQNMLSHLGKAFPTRYHTEFMTERQSCALLRKHFKAELDEVY